MSATDRAAVDRGLDTAVLALNFLSSTRTRVALMDVLLHLAMVAEAAPTLDDVELGKLARVLTAKHDRRCEELAGQR